MWLGPQNSKWGGGGGACCVIRKLRLATVWCVLENRGVREAKLKGFVKKKKKMERPPKYRVRRGSNREKESPFLKENFALNVNCPTGSVGEKPNRSWRNSWFAPATTVRFFFFFPPISCSDFCQTLLYTANARKFHTGRKRHIAGGGPGNEALALKFPPPKKRGGSGKKEEKNCQRTGRGKRWKWKFWGGWGGKKKIQESWFWEKSWGELGGLIKRNLKKKKKGFEGCCGKPENHFSSPKKKISLFPKKKPPPPQLFPPNQSRLPTPGP